MGGWGSGKYAREGARRTTDDLLALDVRTLKREGVIAQGQEELAVAGGALRLGLEWTPSGFAGKRHPRPWFVCPVPEGGCGRRAAILYLEESRFLLCRICLKLAYPSQREDDVLRAKRRAEKARSKLGPDSTVRPKGMHHRTVVRLCHEYLEAYREHVALFNAKWNAKLGKMPRQ
ncbi:MAG: hypothetical protein M3Q49_04085 [Actinomycetota bacterium]|nr:hypothetical protein [Actinomycetota bacterium]